jgi:hypothetical protein
MTTKKWKSYQEVSTYLLNQFAEKFGLGRFEEKQIIPGDSSTEWEIDVKGYSADGSHFVVVECKRYTKNRVSQAITSSLAWVIQDTGATGGILVSPLGLQKGAQKVAAKAGICEVRLDKDSTTTDYVLRFLNQVCLGFSDTTILSDKMNATLFDENGNVKEIRNA